MKKYFKGRVGRLDYFKATFSVVTILSLILGILISTLKTFYTLSVDDLSAISVLGSIIALLITLPISVKRLHDTNQSGWSLLVFSIIPILMPQLAIVVGIIAFYILFLKKGTINENKYGILSPIGGFLRPLFFITK